jgi:hypothetical protein
MGKKIMDTDLKTLAERVQQLEDVNAIKELKYRYLNACDEKDAQEVTHCFTDGKVDINYGFIGQFDNREDFVALYTRMACNEHIVDMHHAQNPIIQITGADSARGKVALRFFTMNTNDKTCTQMAGHYDDEYKKIDGQWRIIKTHFTARTTEIKNHSGEYSKTVHAGHAPPPVS